MNNNNRISFVPNFLFYIRSTFFIYRGTKPSHTHDLQLCSRPVLCFFACK